MQSGKNIIRMTAMVLLIASCSGCAERYSNRVYAGRHANTWQNVKFGVVTNIRPITIQDETNVPVGAVAGAATGGLLGHMVGGGKGKTLATIGGVMLGGLAGDAVQTRANQSDGLELEIKLDNGQIMSLVQGDTGEFDIGSRVRIVETGGRVTASTVSNVNSGM